MKKADILAVSLLLVFSIPAVKSLFTPGGYTSHDLTHHVIRQISMDRLLSEGQFPPRWSSELNKGYGYPLFLFNYPLPAMIGEVFHKTGFNFVDSVKAVFFVSFLASVLGMYLFLRALLPQSRTAAFLGALFYLYAPIRFLVVYVSAALGSAVAFAFVPFVFWAILGLSGKKEKIFILAGSLAFAALILSHNVTALMFSLIFLFFVLLEARISINYRRTLYNAMLMFVLGAGLSAFFWLPALIESKYLIYSDLMGRFYADHFPTFWQLIHSPWGYGLSHPGAAEDGLSFQIGLIHIGVILLLIPGIWITRRVRDFWLCIFCLLLFAASVFLMLEMSLPLWDNLPLLGFVQFPARFLILSVFAASIASAILVFRMPFSRLLFFALLTLVLYANRNHLNTNQVFNPGELYYMNLKTTTAMADEHLPKWAKIPQAESPGKLVSYEGDGDITVVEDKSDFFRAKVFSKTGAKLKFNQVYFPGWTLEVNNKPAKFNYLTDKAQGFPIFDIAPGESLVTWYFANTKTRNLANSVSIASALFWIVLWRRPSYKKN